MSEGLWSSDTFRFTDPQGWQQRHRHSSGSYGDFPPHRLFCRSPGLWSALSTTENTSRLTVPAAALVKETLGQVAADSRAGARRQTDHGQPGPEQPQNGPKPAQNGSSELLMPHHPCRALVVYPLICYQSPRPSLHSVPGSPTPPLGTIDNSKHLKNIS